MPKIVDQNVTLFPFQVKEVDYEVVGDKTFRLSVEARQQDNPLRAAQAEVRENRDCGESLGNRCAKIFAKGQGGQQ